MSEKQLEEFGSLIKQVEEASKKHPKTQPSVRGKSSKERLAEYNRLMMKRRRSQEIHNMVMDIVTVLSLAVILYIAFGK